MIGIPDNYRDLLDSDVAILATIGPDGYPQVTALWFLFDEDGTIRLSLNTTRQKVKNLVDRPECTFFILDRANPLRSLEVRATATIKPDSDYSFADKLSKKYGMDLRQMDRPGEQRVAVSLEPIRVNATDLSR